MVSVTWSRLLPTSHLKILALDATHACFSLVTSPPWSGWLFSTTVPYAWMPWPGWEMASPFPWHPLEHSGRTLEETKRRIRQGISNTWLRTDPRYFFYTLVLKHALGPCPPPGHVGLEKGWKGADSDRSAPPALPFMWPPARDPGDGRLAESRASADVCSGGLTLFRACFFWPWSHDPMKTKCPVAMPLVCPPPHFPLPLSDTQLSPTSLALRLEMRCSVTHYHGSVN